MGWYTTCSTSKHRVSQHRIPGRIGNALKPRCRGAFCLYGEHTMEPLTLTMAELAERWQMSSRQALAQIVRHALPAYFYFDGLVFDFADKWHRAHGEVREATELDAHRERLLTVESDLQRQGLHKRGLLKLTQWEARLGDEDLRLLQVEADRK